MTLRTLSSIAIAIAFSGLVQANEPRTLQLAQAKGTAGAAGAGGNVSPPAGRANVPLPGTAGAAGAGAGAAASGSAAGTGANNPATTSPGAPSTNPPGAGSNNAGVTATDPAATQRSPAGTVPPAGNSAVNPAPGNSVVIVPPPGNGVTIHDPMNPNGSGTLENPAARNPQEELTSALRSCQGLPGGERTACEREARRLHGNM